MHDVHCDEYDILHRNCSQHHNSVQACALLQSWSFVDLKHMLLLRRAVETSSGFVMMSMWWSTNHLLWEKKATKNEFMKVKVTTKQRASKNLHVFCNFLISFAFFFIASSSHQWSDDRNWRRCAKNTPVTTGILKRVTCEREESENCTLSHSISAHLCVFLLIEWWMIWFISIVRWNKWKNAFGILTFATNTVVVSPITLQSFRWCCQSLILGAGMRKSGVRTEVIRRE